MGTMLGILLGRNAVGRCILQKLPKMDCFSLNKCLITHNLLLLPSTKFYKKVIQQSNLDEMFKNKLNYTFLSVSTAIEKNWYSAFAIIASVKVFQPAVFFGWQE